MQADGDDIRFADLAGTLQDYWIETGMNTTTTRIWVEVKGVDASSTKDIYMYYGYAGASGVSSKTGTFGASFVNAWHMSGNANDYANSDNGTVDGATLTTDREGTSNEAYGFVTNDGINLADNLKDSDTVGSITFRIKLNSISDQRIITSAYSGGTNPYLTIGTESGGEFVFDIYSGSQIIVLKSPTGAFVADEWADFCIVGTTNGIKMYKNGSELTVTKITGSGAVDDQYWFSTVGGSTDYYTFGNLRRGTPYGFIDGTLDFVRYWDGELTDTQIANMYTATEPTYSIGAEETSGPAIDVTAEYLPILTPTIDTAITNARTGANNKYFNVPIVNDKQIMFIHISQ